MTPTTIRKKLQTKKKIVAVKLKIIVRKIPQKQNRKKQNHQNEKITKISDCWFISLVTNSGYGFVISIPYNFDGSNSDITAIPNKT